MKLMDWSLNIPWPDWSELLLVSNNVISLNIYNEDKQKNIKPLIKEEVHSKNQISSAFLYEMWEPSSESASCSKKPSNHITKGN